MKRLIYCFYASLMLLIAACTNSDDNGFGNRALPEGGLGGGSMPTDVTSSEELFTFDIDFNNDFLSEQETIDPNDEDLIENTNFSNTVTITFAENSVTCAGLPEGVSADISGAEVVITASTSENIKYRLSGNAPEGLFKIYTDRKCALELSNLTLTNPNGPAINIQSKKRVFVSLDENSTNSLADGATYTISDEDAKGVIFSEGQLIFSGKGRLNIDAIGKAGISSDQYLRFRQGNVIDVTASNGNAVRGKDSILISGGVLNISVSGEGNKGMKSDGPLRVAGGRTTIINSAVAYYDSDEADTKGPAGVNSDGDVSIRGGELLIKATGQGGKGITADGELSINSGKVRVITTGSKFSYGSMGGFGGPNMNSSSNNSKSPKGIRSEGAMSISGGDIMSRTTGGSGSEAIESKSTLTITAGDIQTYAYDDAINSAAAMYISGGDVWAVSYNNDGLDSNGNMYISGGTITAFGLGEDGVDVIERGTLSLTGGTLFSLGNTCMTTPNNSSSQAYIYKNNVSGLSSGTHVTLKDGSSAATLFDYTMPFTISRAYMILSLPALTKGNTYTFSVGTATESISL